ncbi:MAG: tetratricopeptide repeat protein, partial [Alphaproteobacteria bacterium]|nr:tetratricopeptide repeat protein [Alphaproteobacteria bacterium]
NPLIAEELARVAAAPPPFIESAAAGLAEGLFDLAGELAQQGRVEGATINVRLALALHRDFPAAQALLGSLLEAAQRWDAAIVLYRSIAPGTPYAWNGRLRTAAVLERIERIEEARGVLEAMAAERPERTDALVALADMLRAREHWAEAITAYDRVFERIRAPEQPSWTLHYTRGIALERAGTWERAEAEFLKALELERDQPLVLNYLGYSWIEQGRNYDRALQMLQRAVSLRPRDGYVTDSLGWVYYRMGDHVEAVRWLERAVELVPDDPVINDHLGDAYWRVGRVNEARFQWNRALSFAPAAKEVPLIEAKLRGGLADDQANSQPPAAQ